MGDGRADPAKTYATVIGTTLVLFGLAGFFYNSSFANGEALVADRAFGLFYVNGWLNLLHLAAGVVGLALAPLSPRLYCLASGLVWTVLAAGGFFGAHGGEAVPAMGGIIPAGTADNLFCLLLGGLAFAAAAAAKSSPSSAHKGHDRAKKPHKSKVNVEGETSGEKATKPAPAPPGIGRPRSAVRSGGSRRTIN